MIDISDNAEGVPATRQALGTGEYNPRAGRALRASSTISSLWSSTSHAHRPRVYRRGGDPRPQPSSSRWSPVSSASTSRIACRAKHVHPRHRRSSSSRAARATRDASSSSLRTPLEETGLFPCRKHHLAEAERSHRLRVTARILAALGTSILRNVVFALLQTECLSGPQETSERRRDTIPY
jgi:hypothetical protein